MKWINHVVFIFICIFYFWFFFFFFFFSTAKGSFFTFHFSFDSNIIRHWWENWYLKLIKKMKKLKKKLPYFFFFFVFWKDWHFFFWKIFSFEFEKQKSSRPIFLWLILLSSYFCFRSSIISIYSVTLIQKINFLLYFLLYFSLLNLWIFFPAFFRFETNRTEIKK